MHNHDNYQAQIMSDNFVERLLPAHFNYPFLTIS